MYVVYGGSFNPPTIAHFKIAEFIMNNLDCETFIFLPVGDAYNKKGLVQATHRVNMLKLLTAKLTNATVSTLEIDSDKVLTTFESLTRLQTLHESKTFSFVLGADNLEELTSWSQYVNLISNFKIIVLRRADIDVDSIISKCFNGYESQFIILDGFEELDISSTMYRESQTNDGICLEEVDEYVHTFNLYGRSERDV